jgi:peptide/nickel transport system substrate-binding protein
MEQIGAIFIVPAKLGASVTLEDFNSGRAAIGTGAYRFRSWTPNDRVVLDANPDWWGGKPTFDSVTLKFIANNAAREAALLSGQWASRGNVTFQANMSEDSSVSFAGIAK